MKKYEFTEETKIVYAISEKVREVTLHRIRAITGFGSVKAGESGGWIENEMNLSHEGKAWVSGDASVCGNAVVCGNAMVCDNAMVYGNAVVSGDASVSGNAVVSGNARVSGNAVVCGNARVSGNAVVCDNAMVKCNAEAYGNARVYGNAVVCDNAEVFLKNHVLVIGAAGSRDDFTTFYRGRDKQVMVKCGCFNGTLAEFLDKVDKTHGNNRHAAVYRAAVEMARLQIDLESKAPKREEGRRPADFERG